jgi:hypothetical protein
MMLSPNIRDRGANEAIAPLAEITQIPKFDFYEGHRLEGKFSQETAPSLRSARKRNYLSKIVKVASNNGKRF